MKRIGGYIRHNLTRAPGTATYDQCQHIYALMKSAGLEPKWCDTVPYAKAVQLINTLTELNEINRGR